MAGFLYFVSGAHGSIDNARAKELGLDYAFPPTGSIYSTQIAAGPDGKKGLLLSVRNEFTDEKYPAAYVAERQKWHKLPGTDGVDIWVGVYRHAMPGPDNLLAPSRVNGYPIKLLDGGWWYVPTVKMPCDTAPAEQWDDALPCDVAMDDSGRPVRGAVQDRHKTIQTVAERHLPVVLGDSDPMEPAEAIEAAVILLATNYRVRLAEVVLLGLLTFDGVEARGILDWAVGMPKIWQLIEGEGEQQKKSEDRSEQPSNDGEPDGCPDTDPA